MVAAGSGTNPGNGHGYRARVIKQRRRLEEVIGEFGTVVVQNDFEIPGPGPACQILWRHGNGYAADVLFWLSESAACASAAAIAKTAPNSNFRGVFIGEESPFASGHYFTFRAAQITL